MRRTSIFLIMVISVAGIAGCGTTPVQYELTITSTTGGNVTEPGEGTFIYEEGAIVSLVAEAEGGYGFAEWTGEVETITDVSAAATTIIMNDSYSITDSFGIIIEIRDWNDLDAIRDNLDGFYLLMNDLDSTTPGYEELAGPAANGGKGWQPIEDKRFARGFGGVFDGQGHQIRDLYIDRPDERPVGLFARHWGVVRDTGVVNGTVTGAGTAGGLAGFNAGTVSHCYFTGNVTSARTAGGLVGSSQGNVIACYSTGNVIGNSDVGGLVGVQWMRGVVTACCSSSNVAGVRSVGGLVGVVQFSTVTDSYSIGWVAGEEQYVDGLIGHYYKDVIHFLWDPETSVNHCFWDIDTSGQTASWGGTGKTTAEMKDIATFLGAPWNITTVADPGARNTAYIWNIVDGVTYPFLSSQ